MRWMFTRALVAGLVSAASCAMADPQAVDDGLAFALRSAVTTHPQVLSKLGELRALGFQVEESEAARLPSFSAETRTRTDTSTGGSGLARLTQPLWAFGRIDKTIDVARQRQETGRLELLEVRRKLMEDTASAYNQVLLQRDRLQVAQLNENEHAALLALISRRAEGGLASQADIRLANLRLSQARLAVRQILGALEKAQQDLQTYAQSTVMARQPLDPAWLSLPAKPWLMDAIDDQHATLRVRSQRLQTIADELALRKLELLPTVSARMDRNIPNSGTNAIDSGRVMLVLEGRIDGAGLVGQARIKAQADRLEAAQQDVESARIEARQRLSNLLTERDLQGDSVEVQTSVAVSTRDTMDSILRQYDAGRKSWLDLLNTQRELADVRQQLEAARGSWREQALRIAIMLGRLDNLTGLTP